MAYNRGFLDLALSGGGVKGIAYIGVFDAMEKRGYKPGNIAGVSAGALGGAFAGAGYTAGEIWDAMEELDFKGIQLENASRRLPVVNAYIDFLQATRFRGEDSIMEFLHARGNRSILDSIILYSKYGSLFDGDLLEEWVAGHLKKKGIRTFADLRTGKAGNVNPAGYKLRMTGVDCNRAKLVVIPDDMAFYGIDPDEFEVARAVRISTCVPFAFKPVEIKKLEKGRMKSCYLVDGGVFDRFPYWLIDSAAGPAVGFTLCGGERKKFFCLDTALNILKSLISAVQDIGIPEDAEKKRLKYVGEINTTKVYYLDFNLDGEEKKYLYNAGKQTATSLFNRYEQEMRGPHRGAYGFRHRFFMNR